MSSPEEWPDPNKWVYQEGSGEFYRVKKRLPGGVIVYDRTPYVKRVSQFQSGKKLRRAFTIGAIACGVVAYLLYGNGDTPMILVAMPLGIVALCLGLMRVVLLFVDRGDVVGPAPRRRPADDFGPGVATSPVDHPASDDLAYRPTA